MTTFLSPGEREEYLRPLRCKPRQIIEGQPGAAASAPVAPEPLPQFVIGRLHHGVNTPGVWFECHAIRVRMDDGMSWSAEAVHDVVGAAHPQFTRWCLARRTAQDMLPVISTVLGTRRFVRLAVHHGMTARFVAVRTWVGILNVAVSLLLGVGAHVASAAFAQRAQGNLAFTDRLSDPWLWVIAGLFVAIGQAIQYRVVLNQTGLESSNVRDLIEEIERRTGTYQYDQFIEGLAEALTAAEFPRVCIVDNFDRLDGLTRAVIQRYFERSAARAIGSELWVIFEPFDGETLRNRAALQREAYGHGRFRWLE